MRLNLNEVALKLGLKSNRKISVMSDLQLLKKKDKTGVFWESEDIDKYLNKKEEEELKKKVEVVESTNKKMSMKEVMSDSLRSYIHKYLRYYHSEDSIIYRKSKDIRCNEWAVASLRLQHDLDKIKYNNGKDSLLDHLNNIYAREIMKGEIDFLLTPTELKASNYTTIERKMDRFVEELKTDPFFRVDSVPSFSNDKNEITFRFFDLNNAVAEGLHPHWDIWETQIPTQDVAVYRAFVFSIFVAKNKSRQILWLHDVGETGKSMTTRTIGSFGGETFSNFVNIVSLRDKFFGTHFAGHRLIVFDDLDDLFFLSNPIIKAVSGGAPITVEGKGKQPYQSQVNAKIVVLSNYKPIIDGSQAQNSRLILINLKKSQEENFRYMKSLGVGLTDLLLSEIPFYLNTCRESYNTLCKNDGDIELSEFQKNSVLECQDLDVRIVSNFFHTYFQKSKEEGVSRSLLDRCMEDYKNRNNSVVDFAKFVKYTSSQDVIIKSDENNNIISQKHIGMALRDCWYWDGSYLELRTSSGDEKNNFGL